MALTSPLQAHSRFNISLKPCLNLCLFKQLNSSLKPVKGFKPSGSQNENKGFSYFH